MLFWIIVACMIIAGVWSQWYIKHADKSNMESEIEIDNSMQELFS